MNKMKRAGFLVAIKKIKTNQKKKKQQNQPTEKGCSQTLNVKKVAKLQYVVLKSNYVDIIFPLCWVQFC